MHLKPRLLAAGSLAALVLGACASDPYYYSERPYTSSPAYYDGSSRYYDRSYAAVSDEGRVVAIDRVRGERGTTGGGAVLGGIAGGVLGHQIGSGRGNTAATVAGAVGGAVVGNEIERNRSGMVDDHYRITVQLRDGREAVFAQRDLDGLRVGDRVRIDGNRLYRG